MVSPRTILATRLYNPETGPWEILRNFNLQRFPGGEYKTDTPSMAFGALLARRLRPYETSCPNLFLPGILSVAQACNPKGKGSAPRSVVVVAVMRG